MPVCNAHHTPTPSDTVVRSANGTAEIPAPVLIIAVVDVDMAAENETRAATLVAFTASEAPGATW